MQAERPREPTKRQRRRLRELAAIAYDRELARELESLRLHFERWRAGEIGPHELSDLIHEFHQGPSRQLFTFYTRNQPEWQVAHALADGLLTEAEVGEELLPHVASLVAFYQREAQR